MVFKVEKRAKNSLNLERSEVSPGAKIKTNRQQFVDLQYCQVPKNGLLKNGQVGISSKNKNDPRLETFSKERF